MNFGCSCFTWKTTDNRHLLGRTYDQFGDLTANRVIALPQGAPCAPGLRADGGVPGRYGYTGMAVLGFGEPILVDGVNSAGLMGALLHYPEYASYPSAPVSGRIGVHPGRLLAWLLSQCASATQAAEEMGRIVLTDEPVQGRPLPAHYMLSDLTGEAVVLEPDSGGLVIHRTAVGVLANSPNYLWHLTNLQNYAGVTNLPAPRQTVAGRELRGFGERMGRGVGLPGDYSSPSRFIRLAFMREYAVPGSCELDGVTRMFRAFAPVELPEGLARAEHAAYEQTLCISVMCAESGVYYFSPAQNRRISAVRPLTQGQETQYFELSHGQDIDYRN